MKVSFDFDSTLSIDIVEQYAKELIEQGHEIWIVTSRFKYFDKSRNKVNNSDLYEVADRIGIKEDHIHFCEMENKSEFLKDKEFLWHLDDDAIELSFIRTDTTVFPIWRYQGINWKQQCQDLLRILTNKFKPSQIKLITL